MKRVVLASGNAKKLAELSALVADFGLEMVPQSELGVTDADETGVTFEENALIKARHAAATTGLPAIADDSGILVEELCGRPGVYSARFAGPGADDAKNNAKLLAELEGVTDRRAHYVCVIALVRSGDDMAPILCRGRWDGEILHAPRGSGGFGYDPLFFVPALGCTAAELDPVEKNKISHRAKALAELRRLFGARQ